MEQIEVAAPGLGSKSQDQKRLHACHAIRFHHRSQIHLQIENYGLAAVYAALTFLARLLILTLTLTLLAPPANAWHPHDRR